MQFQHVILKVRLLSNKIPWKEIDFSLEVHKTEISQMDLLSTMRQCGIELLGTYWIIHIIQNKPSKEYIKNVNQEIYVIIQ